MQILDELSSTMFFETMPIKSQKHETLMYHTKPESLKE